jgi:hypothetical protein
VGQVVCLIRTPVKGVMSQDFIYQRQNQVSIRTPVKGVIAKRDKKSRFMGGSPHLPPENHLVFGDPPPPRLSLGVFGPLKTHQFYVHLGFALRSRH